MWTVNKIRQTFLDYFKEKGHEVVPSSSLVPQNDPTLLFTNAGMVQFKNVFTGLEKPPYCRAATIQKCLRAGGKHNDLENVGYTARHHTFFEMMGNFSFGDYFKEEAIDYAWTLVTQVFKISPDRLLVTVFNEDEEAAALWRKVAGLPDHKILRISGSDNFWSMGDTGPCGPCSEIFYDHGEHIPGGPPGTPEAEGDRFVEIWNLVFMQYDQQADGTRIPLPKPSIDTGCGLERLAAVLQNVHDNYDIDLFQALIRTSQELTGVYDKDQLISHRVMADHLRSSCFLISEGVLPSNEGRGYVLRRIMRRAMRHAYLLGAKEPLIHRLVPVLLQEMGDAYPALGYAQEVIKETLRLEEERFLKTLERGLVLLDQEISVLPSDKPLAGQVAFKLYDTYGFPLDLTEDILRSKGRKVDVAGFEAAMVAQKETARKAWVGSGESQEEAVWFSLSQRISATEFLGYTSSQALGTVAALVQEGKEVKTASKGEVSIIVNQTPFYAESGGQIGDQGSINSSLGFKGYVTDCQKKGGGLSIHLVRIDQGSLAVGDTVSLSVDEKRRQLIRANHSATHLLHAVLRKIVGSHVVQKGSLVAPDRLRFDFSAINPLSRAELARIEEEVNKLIRDNTATHTALMTPDKALKEGAIGLFGEKYGEEVRVVSMGTSLEEGISQDKEGPYSQELCGGTHVHRTGDIGYFKIIAESGIAAGVRRIEAITGPQAEVYAREMEWSLKQASSLLKSTPDQVIPRLEALLEDRRKLERELQALKKKIVQGNSSDISLQLLEVGEFKVLVKTLEDIAPQELKSLADQLKKQIGSGVVVLGAHKEGRGSLVVGITADLTDRVNSVDLVRLGAEALGGQGGGGRPDMAQAGGPNGQDLEKAYTKIREFLENLG